LFQLLISTYHQPSTMILDRRHDILFNTMSFPAKLHALLEDADKQGFQNIICWQPGGKSFAVHKPEIYANHIMQAYFAQTKFKSFQRQRQ